MNETGRAAAKAMRDAERATIEAHFGRKMTLPELAAIRRRQKGATLHGRQAP
jgi:hypothetical protein